MYFHVLWNLRPLCIGKNIINNIFGKRILYFCKIYFITIYFLNILLKNQNTSTIFQHVLLLTNLYIFGVHLDTFHVTPYVPHALLIKTNNPHPLCKAGGAPPPQVQLLCNTQDPECTHIFWLKSSSLCRFWRSTFSRTGLGGFLGIMRPSSLSSGAGEWGGAPLCVSGIILHVSESGKKKIACKRVVDD